MILELIRQAYNALKFNRRRSILTMLGMAWGIATPAGLQTGLRSRAIRQIFNL